MERGTWHLERGTWHLERSRSLWREAGQQQKLRQRGLLLLRAQAVVLPPAPKAASYEEDSQD